MKFRLSCYAWALIPNHAHFLFETGPYPLHKLMAGLLTGYALYFNKKHDRVGHLFQNRYQGILCNKEEYYFRLIRYIHLNPLKAGLVPDLSSLNRYPWCGQSVLMGNRKAEWQDTDSVFRYFGPTRRRARHNYLLFLRQGINQEEEEDLSGGGLIRSAGGWERVKEMRNKGESWKGDQRILGNDDFVERVLRIANDQLTKKEEKRAEGWDLERLLEYVPARK